MCLMSYMVESSSLSSVNEPQIVKCKKQMKTAMLAVSTKKSLDIRFSTIFFYSVRCTRENNVLFLQKISLNTFVQFFIPGNPRTKKSSFSTLLPKIYRVSNVDNKIKKCEKKEINLKEVPVLAFPLSALFAIRYFFLKILFDELCSKTTLTDGSMCVGFMNGTSFLSLFS